MIYVDGSHFFDDVFVDAYFAFRLLTEDGVVMFDDSSTEHVAKVLSFINMNWGNWTEEVGLSAYRADGDSLRYRLAVWLGMQQLRAFRRTGVDQRAWDAPLRKFKATLTLHRSLSCLRFWADGPFLSLGMSAVSRTRDLGDMSTQNEQVCCASLLPPE